jgi:hypothetical protein
LVSKAAHNVDPIDSHVTQGAKASKALSTGADNIADDINVNWGNVKRALKIDCQDKKYYCQPAKPRACPLKHFTA